MVHTSGNTDTAGTMNYADTVDTSGTAGTTDTIYIRT